MKSYKNDNGYIVVETVGAFIPFMLLVISILSLVNIVTLQVRLHYALTQTAGALSMYCYVLKATGISDSLIAMESRAADFGNTLDSVAAELGALSGNGGSAGDVLNMAETAASIAGDPVKLAKDFANYGLSGLKNTLTPYFVEPMVRGCLSSSVMTADEYLNRLRITKFSLTNCVIIDSDENVRLTAEYEVEYTFGALKLPFAPTLRISQTAVTKAWLGGSGKGYQQ